MKRRDFLAGCGASAGALYAPRLHSQGSQPPRAAIVIGVNKAGLLPRLNGAVSGARQVAKWLDDEKFDTTVPVDEACHGHPRPRPCGRILRNPPC